MSSEDHPREAEFEEASTKLSEGLRSCRAMVADYRAMLERESEAGDEQADSGLYQFAGASRDCGSGSFGDREQI